MGSLRNRNELWKIIKIGSNEIRNNLEIFDSVRNSLRRRASACLEENIETRLHKALVNIVSANNASSRKSVHLIG
jgi:hypothetical protein